MDRIKALLQKQCQPGIYRTKVRATTNELSHLIQEHSFQLFYIDGAEISGKETFLRKSAEVMGFPEYFGNNWDAYEECIKDLEWCKAKGYIILYDHLEKFAQIDPKQWNIAFDILHSAVEFWRATDSPMYVLIRSDSSAVAELTIL